MDLDESPAVFDLLRQSVRRPSFSEAYDDDDPSEESFDLRKSVFRPSFSKSYDENTAEYDAAEHAPAFATPRSHACSNTAAGTQKDRLCPPSFSAVDMGAATARLGGSSVLMRPKSARRIISDAPLAGYSTDGPLSERRRTRRTIDEQSVRQATLEEDSVWRPGESRDSAFTPEMNEVLSTLMSTNKAIELMDMASSDEDIMRALQDVELHLLEKEGATDDESRAAASERANEAAKLANDLAQHSKGGGSRARALQGALDRSQRASRLRKDYLPAAHRFPHPTDASERPSLLVRQPTFDYEQSWLRDDMDAQV